MPPKKEKERGDDDNYWRILIEQTPLNEPTWNVKVVIFETAGSEQEIMYLNKFETFAKEEKRFVIKNICKSETMFMVNQLGAEKKVKDESLRVFEEGHMYLKEKKDIPPDILALIIKHLVLKMKQEYLSIQKQIFVVREGMRNESLTMIDRSEIRNNMPLQSVQPSEPVEPPHPKGKGKKDETDVASTIVPEEGKKYNTLLRVRGEEWRDKVYVDDFPLDGPNLYLAITGFLEPYLLESLMKIGVPLTAVVQIRIDPATNKISSGYFTGTKRGHSAIELAAEKSYEFWKTLQELRLDNTSAPNFKDMAFIVFTPPYGSSDTLSSSADRVYDELSFLMYDIQDLTRQHAHYLDNMDVKCIPTESKNMHMLKSYCDQLNEIPLECTTIFSIIDSMLQTICYCAPCDSKSGTTSLSTDFTIMQNSFSTKSPTNFDKADNLVNKVFDTLSKGDLNKKNYRITCGEEYDKYKDPVIINYGDCAQCTTFHLENINLDNIIWSSLVNMPICNLWQNQAIPSEEIQAKVNFHLSALHTCFDKKELDDSLFSRLVHMLSFRKLYNNRSSLKKGTVPPTSISEFKKIYLKRSTFAEPFPKTTSLFWTSSATSPPSPTIVKSYSYTKEFNSGSSSEEQRVELLFDCPDLSELVSALEITNDKPVNHLIDEYDFFEDFSGINSLQVLLKAFTKFNCLNYKYCEVTDDFVMMFYNNHDSDGISREEWRCHLPTPVCLQDFFDFVLEEEYQWIQDEEKLYDECTLLKTKLEWKESLDKVPTKSCVENIDDIDSELLITGSLKYQERIQNDSLEEEDVDQNASLLPKMTVSSTSSPDSKSSRKPKSTPENKKKGVDVISDADNVSEYNTYLKRFSGYNLGERRVEVFGKDSIFFSKDGTKICSFYTIIIPMNLEYLVLNVVPGNENNEFWMQKKLGDAVPANIDNVGESFRIISKDQVTYYLKKNWYQPPIPTVTSLSSQSKVKHNDNSSKTKVKTTSSVNTLMCDSKLYHTFVITWPNGLIIESVNDDNSPKVNHIKQFYVSHVTNINEDMRCMTLNGEVVIFKKSGIIEIYRPDATYIKIIKCSKRIVHQEIIEEIRSASSSEKNKKLKGKSGSAKDKLGKSTSKSSKSAIEQNETSVGTPHYELFIDEFEITDSNGLKEKWVNNQLVSAEKLLVRTATDYNLGEVFSRRMDGTYTLLNKDGMFVATFYDNTRIITTYSIDDEDIYPEVDSTDLLNSRVIFENDKTSKDVGESAKSKDSLASRDSSISDTLNEDVREEEKEVRTDGFVSIHVTHTIENANFATVTVNKANGDISVDSSNKTSLVLDTNGNYEFLLDKSTNANFDGDSLNINFEACNQCESTTTCTVNINNMKSASDIDQTWLTMKDSFGKNIVVDVEGAINIVTDPIKDEVEQNKDEKVSYKPTASCLTLLGKCREMYDAKALRFFVFRRDLSCSELVHRSLMEQYKNHCRWQPWCSINEYDTFGDHRRILSILTPLQLTETEKWLMRSKYCDKPKHLKFKDLKEDTGKGFYHWMRPYGRFQPEPKSIEEFKLPRLPRAYVLRTLELLWDEESRNDMKGGKEMVKAVLKYRRMMQSESEAIQQVPIRDPRTEEEKKIDEKLQEIAHRIYLDLKNELSDNIHSSARPTITTESQKPPQPPIFAKTGEVACEELKRAWQDKQDEYVRVVEEISRPSENLQRYWRRRREEAKEEEFFKQLLREESIPPYFRNMLGGAAWWEVNNMAGEAVTRAGRSRCECQRPTSQNKNNTNIS
ncbi:PREDICTED: uncharacterized protein LOC106113881 [Papilio xuthus]|uniref:Uncharacterized protein LOC106113881 n=1 Tax=Papilio xuthus TaxID=66420 RepID=A0AAJ6Z029_PAPXU|nr:PREDICTED: uncharacterized protein LOC106113881 [Papilio xuthus]